MQRLRGIEKQGQAFSEFQVRAAPQAAGFQQIKQFPSPADSSIGRFIETAAAPGKAVGKG
jgi:hypothetical protein